jgi:hypothetical protein
VLIKLKYRKKLGYAGAKYLPPISVEDAGNFPEGSAVMTFREPEGCRNIARMPVRTERNVSALTRFSRIVPVMSSSDITLHGIEIDSPLAAIIVWDVAHALPVGGVLRLTGNLSGKHQADLPYFAGSLERRDVSDSVTEYLKVSQLAAEKSSLDAWTFGIPVGPEDATLLNACVKRILELDVPDKEIVLCGRPGGNFKYWDQVRVVGEDIAAPPVQIARKKNRIAQEARHPNLCIIHDRVFLPKNFMEAVRRFGNAYPLTTFQSIYFDDKWNLVPRRYSDFNVAPKVSFQTTIGLVRGEELRAGQYSPTTFALVERGGFAYANPNRSSPMDYPTGSLYICKRDVWLSCPQDESLAWAEFEDVEHGARAARMGIPSRVNQYSFTQSMISRPMIAWLGSIRTEKPNGVIYKYRALLESLPFPRKPMLKKTKEQAARDVARFAAKYASGIPQDVLATGMHNARARLAVIARIIHNVRLPVRKAEVQEFLKDYEKLIVCDQMSYQWFEYAAHKLVTEGGEGMTLFCEESSELFNQAALRPENAVFAQTMSDFLPRNGLMNRIGSLVSAVLLGLESNRTFVFDGGVFRRYRLIRESTPFLDYAS